MSKRNVLISMLTILFSCASTNLQWQRHDVGCLTFFTPANMRLENVNGIDTYVKLLIDDKRDTFYLEYGDSKVIDKVYDPVPSIWETTRKEHFLKESGKLPDPSDLLFSDNPKEDESQDIFDKNYYQYDTVNSIILPNIRTKGSDC